MLHLTRFKFIATTIVVAVASSFVTIAIMTAQPASPLTRGLDGRDWRRASTEFDARVQSRFKPGMPIVVFLAALKEEGFEPMWSSTNGFARGYGARRVEGGFPCSADAQINWWPDRSRRQIAAVRGFRQEACL